MASAPLWPFRFRTRYVYRGPFQTFQTFNRYAQFKSFSD
jgi:hypothetical protein